ncbi:MAG: tRNA (adenosine(37)-N6)-dimethylallyltransferase MiaA [Anaerolineae bacterium]
MPPLVVIVGPTAVGKTGLALALAEALNGEIIGADSRQVYRFMDIGTAKPTAEQRAQVPHYGIDLIEPDETLSLATYLAHAHDAIRDIQQRGKLPLLVGGTGQYVTALMEGWSVPSVPPNESLRAELEAYAAENGAAALGERLKALDPVAYEAIDYRNVRRVIRALEVIAATGQPFSTQRIKTPPPYRMLHYALTMERDALYERADRRVDAMIDEGFIDEVQGLLDRGYSPDLPAMSGLGYTEIVAYLRDTPPTFDETRRAIYHATHDFIRRQYTWFRKYNAEAVWLDTSAVDSAKITMAIREQIDASA